MGLNLTTSDQTNLNALIDEAVVRLKKGEVVAFPTETVYGLGACIDQPLTIEKIFTTKQRPFFDPLIVHVPDTESAKKCFKDWDLFCDHLAMHFWPGPLTLVMPKSNLISDMITSGLPNVGVRIPKNETALKLLQQIGVPLAAPSANKFGQTSPTQAMHVEKEFNSIVSGQVFVIHDQPSQVGIESTVLFVEKNTDQHTDQNTVQYSLSILRKGIILKSDIEKSLAKTTFKYVWNDQIDKKNAPGHMKHHYMPAIPFVICKNPALKLSELSQILNQRLNQLPDTVEGVKIVKPTSSISKIEFLQLSKNPEIAAREIYSQLRLASDRKPQVLCLIQMPHHQSELWESVFDRLYKAASLIIE